MKTGTFTGPDRAIGDTFERLPEELRVIAAKLTIKQIALHALEQRLNVASDEVTRLRNELAEKAEIVETLKVELRDACKKHAKEIL